MTASPQVSVIIPHPLRSTAAGLTDFARHAEDAGLHGLFVGDHLTPAVPMMDSTLTLAVAAAATSRIRLGFGVMVLGLRHPAWAARQVATLQQLSGNRVILGVGLGGPAHGTAAWQAVGVPYAERGARTDAALGILRDLISGEPTVLPNGTELTLTPGAAPPPVWIGGNGAGARKRTVRYGDAWFPSMITPAELASGVTDLAGLPTRRDQAASPAVAVGGSVLLGTRPPAGALEAHIAMIANRYRVPAETARQLPLHGAPAAVAGQLRRYADAGGQHVVLGLIGDDWRRQCDLLAEAARLAGLDKLAGLDWPFLLMAGACPEAVVAGGGDRQADRVPGRATACQPLPVQRLQLVPQPPRASLPHVRSLLARPGTVVGGEPRLGLAAGAPQPDAAHTGQQERSEHVERVVAKRVGGNGRRPTVAEHLQVRGDQLEGAGQRDGGNGPGRHETAAERGEVAACPAAGDPQQRECAAADFPVQVDEDERAGRGLAEPRGRDRGQRAGGDDPVVWCGAREAVRAVADREGWRVAPFRQPLPRRADEVRVDVDAGDQLAAEPGAQQRGVVAGSGADFEYPLAAVEVEGFKHPGHQRRLG